MSLQELTLAVLSLLCIQQLWVPPEEKGSNKKTRSVSGKLSQTDNLYGNFQGE
jgi:hypothetical protein